MLCRIAPTLRIGLTASRRLARPALAAPVSPSSAPLSAPWTARRRYATQPPKDEPPSNEAAESAKGPDAQPIPLHKLPDLTQGIPSTLDAELAERAGRTGPASLTAVEEPSAGGGGGRGGERRESYVSTSERNRKRLTRFLLMAAGTGSLLGVAYLGRDWEDEIEASRHPEIPNGWTPGRWWARTRARWGESVSYYQDPAFDKLLPDADPSFERPYTLCLSLDDMLVHSEWSREHGWRVAKRPGMDYFIRYLSQYYELVLFTTVPFAMGEPLVRKLDPFRFIMWPLYREATKYEDGELIKDLSYLNRDLSKVIIVDTKPQHVRKQPENAIILDPWKGDASDKELVALIPFLEYIHTVQYSDVRKVLKSFEGKHIPTEFARREAIARREHRKKVEARRGGSGGGFGLGGLGNLLGMKPGNMSMTVMADGEQSPSEAFAEGKMLQDIARERGIRNYQHLEREIRENGEKWLKEDQVAMEKAQQEAMNSMMGSFSGWFVKKDEKRDEKV